MQRPLEHIPHRRATPSALAPQLHEISKQKAPGIVARCLQR
jgi:hypothetical protein